MDSNIDFEYNKIIYKNFDDFIIKIINIFKNKQLLLNNKKINITFIKLLDNNYCELCDKYADYYGFCIEHYDQDKINKYRDDFIENIIKCNNTQTEFINYYFEYHKTLKNYIKKIKLIQKYYFNNIYTLLNFKNQKSYKIHNTKYINNIYNINYNELNVIFDDEISHNIIYNFNSNIQKSHNIIIFLIYLLKKYTYDYINLKMLYKNPQDNINKKTFIGNNNILYNKIYNSKIINNIEYMETERPLHINNTTLRIDLYIIINSYNVNDNTIDYFEIFIECDEKHHYNKNNIKNDILKDKYCIENNISLLRLEIKNNRIDENEINFCIFFINYIKEYNKSVYYFSDRYIETHKIKLKNDNDMITFGRINKLSDINNYDNIYDIKNIDLYIKSKKYLTDIINKFSNINNI